MTIKDLPEYPEYSRIPEPDVGFLATLGYSVVSARHHKDFFKEHAPGFELQIALRALAPGYVELEVWGHNRFEERSLFRVAGPMGAYLSIPCGSGCIIDGYACGVYVVGFYSPMTEEEEEASTMEVYL